MNRETAVLLCRLVAGLVVTDDDLDAKEDALLERLLASFGIPSSEREVIFPIIDATEAVQALRDQPASVRDQALALLIEGAAVDGKIADEERKYLLVVADAMGIPHAELEARLAKQLAQATS